MGYGLKESISANPERVEAAKRNLGKLIIAINELDPQKLSPIQILENYTDQGVSVERGFRFLKDPLFFADSLFLKKTERIMALMTIMGLALLIYALAERQLLLALDANNEMIPDWMGKQSSFIRCQVYRAQNCAKGAHKTSSSACTLVKNPHKVQGNHNQ
jgi:transposase